MCLTNRPPKRGKPKSHFEPVKDVKARIQSSVSIVWSTRNWGFFALRGTDRQTPSWILIEEQKVISDLGEIVLKLRSYLKDASDVDWTNDTCCYVDDCFTLIYQNAVSLLSNKKKRSIRLLMRLLEIYAKGEKKASVRAHLLEELLGYVKQSNNREAIDFHDLAQQWLELVQPVLIDIKQGSKQKGKVFSLEDTFTYFKKTPVSDTAIEGLLNGLKISEGIERRVVSCIIGLKKPALLSTNGKTNTG